MAGPPLGIVLTDDSGWEADAESCPYWFDDFGFHHYTGPGTEEKFYLLML